MELTPIKLNVTELILKDYVVLFSYITPVAYQDRRTGEFYRTSTKYSRTTSRHINQWLDGIKAKEVAQAEIDLLTE